MPERRPAYGGTHQDSARRPHASRRRLGTALVAFATLLSPLLLQVGQARATTIDAPVVGMAYDPATGGYWEVAADGGIFSFDAAFYGSTGAMRLAEPIVGMASTPDGGGYWLVASDGGVFSFGDAAFYGSTGAMRLAEPIVGMASTPDGRGYWLAASDGGVFSFGNAAFFGSTGATHLAKPIVGMASTHDGGGYWLAAADGGVFTFGDAAFEGSMGGQSLAAPVTGTAADPRTGGYWMSTYDGGVLSFGAPFYGSMGGDYSPGTGAADPYAARIVQVASSQLGQTDGSRYGGGGNWCAYFASWVYDQAGLPMGSLPEAYEIGSWALSNGGTLLSPGSVPQVGDAVLYEPTSSSAAWPGPGLDAGNIVHVNIVVSVNPDGSFVTIGGNEPGSSGVAAVREFGPYSAANAASWWGQNVYAFVQPAS